MFPTSYPIWIEPVEIDGVEQRRRQEEMRKLHRSLKLEQIKTKIWLVILCSLILLLSEELVKSVIIRYTHLAANLVDLVYYISWIPSTLIIIITGIKLSQTLKSKWKLTSSSIGSTSEYEYSMEKILMLNESETLEKQSQKLLKVTSILLVVLRTILLLQPLIQMALKARPF